MADKSKNSEIYRRRASELRTKADAMNDPIASQSLVRLAREYDVLATAVDRIDKSQERSR